MPLWCTFNVHLKLHYEVLGMHNLCAPNVHFMYIARKQLYIVLYMKCASKNHSSKLHNRECLEYFWVWVVFFVFGTVRLPFQHQRFYR